MSFHPVAYEVNLHNSVIYGGMGLHNAIADISNTAVLIAAANRGCHTLLTDHTG
jgi:predicted membrane protein